MHTKTPWTLTTVQTSSGICHKIGPFPWKDGNQNHACIYADYPGQGPAEAELLANARLIAAAPDLLAALQHVYNNITSEGGHGVDMDIVHAAVAKALVGAA